MAARKFNTSSTREFSGLYRRREKERKYEGHSL